MNELRPYQREVAKAVMESVNGRKGLTFCVEIARQGGKNELSARLEFWQLLISWRDQKNLVKCSPTFKPQTAISIGRLKETLNAAGYKGDWASDMGYIVKFGNARAIFLSADRSANVVGHTAHLLLEVDEAQDVSKEKYTKEFKPMGATTNVTTVLYGTTWDDSTLLEETKQTCLELEKKDGIKRCFHYDWQEVSKYNPDYLAYVEGERQRLGEDHPLFRTQYRLLPVRGGGGFLSAEQKAQLQGEHARKHRPEQGKIYVAGIDLAGEAEEEEDAYLKRLNIRQDSTVITIGELDLSVANMAVGWAEILPRRVPEGRSPPSLSADSRRVGESFGGRTEPTINPPVPAGNLANHPGVRIVEHYRWTGKKHTDLYPQLVDIIKNVWHCKKVVVDATGVGQPVASFLREAVGSAVIPFTFTAPAKSALGFDLLAAVNSGRLKMYAGDSSIEYRDFWSEMEKARSYYRPSQTMNFYVDPSAGHDDFLMSLALVVHAANGYERRVGRGSTGSP